MIRYLLFFTLLLSSCAGYQLGGMKPTHLSNVNSLHVPLFKNDTLLIRAESLATNSAVDALTRDGTYSIATAETADAVLEGTVSKVDYSQVRTDRLDSLRSEELGMTVTIDWILRDGDDPSHILEQGSSTGVTRFFAGGNLLIARANALPDTLRRATESMVLRIANGF